MLEGDFGSEELLVSAFQTRWKQARAAQRLNANRVKTSLDDEEVRGHVVALRRLVTVCQSIRPNTEPSKNAG